MLNKFYIIFLFTLFFFACDESMLIQEEQLEEETTVATSSTTTSKKTLEDLIKNNLVVLNSDGKVQNLVGFETLIDIDQSKSILEHENFVEMFSNNVKLFSFESPQGVATEISMPILESSDSLGLTETGSTSCKDHYYTSSEPSINDVLEVSSEQEICGTVDMTVCLRMVEEGETVTDTTEYAYTSTPAMSMEIPCKEDSFVDLTMSIESGKKETASSQVEITTNAGLSVLEVYLTESIDCATNGKWVSLDGSKILWDFDWEVGQTEGTIYAKFKDVYGESSNCFTDSIKNSAVIIAKSTTTSDSAETTAELVTTTTTTTTHESTVNNDSTQETTPKPTVTINTLSTITMGNVSSYSLSGTCSEANQTVTVTVGGITNTPSCSSNTWSITSWNVSAVNDSTSLSFTADHANANGQNADQASTTVLKDTTPPQVPTIVATSAWNSSVISSPNFSWQSSGSSVTYEVAMGTSSGATDVVDWQAVGATLSHVFTNLTLTECTSYYMVVRAVDNVGNKSLASNSAAFKPDVTAPAAVSAVTTSTVGSTTQSRAASWSASTDNCQLDQYEIAIGTTSGGTEAHNYTSIGNVTTYTSQNGVNGITLALKFGQKYYTSIRVSDAAGNVSSVVTSDYWEFFNPNDLSETYAWYDSSDLSTLFQNEDCSSSPVTQELDEVGCWKDKSASQINMTSSATNKPHYESGDIRFIRDQSDILKSYHTGSFSAFEFLIVFEEVSRSSGFTRWFHDTGHMTFTLPYTDGTAIWDFNNGTNSRLRTSYIGAANLPKQLYNLRSNGSTRKIIINSSTTYASNKGYTFSTTNSVLDFMQRTNTKVSEFIITNAILDVANTEKIEAYLMCKTGIGSSLPSGHTYENDCP